MAVAKRQVEELTARSATDVDAFYATVEREPAADDDVLVLSCDGKGIVMRPDSLRPATERAAAVATTKLETRLSKGEKRNRRRPHLVPVRHNCIASSLARSGADTSLHALPEPAISGRGPASEALR